MAQNETAKEYKQFESFCYIDYNVFSYISSYFDFQEDKTHQKAFALYAALKLFVDNKKLCLPYSIAHMRDILQGNRNFEKKKKTLQDLTGGWFISEDQGNSNFLRVDKCTDILEHFRQIVDTESFLKEMQQIFDPLIEEAFNTMMIRNQRGDSCSEDIDEKLQGLSSKMRVRTAYDVLKYAYAMAKELNNSQIGIDILEATKEELIDYVNKLLHSGWMAIMLNADNIEEFEGVFQKNTNGQNLSTFFSKMLCYSFLADFIGIIQEERRKIYKDTFSYSMINDLLHLSYGVRCHIFVTNDKRLMRKAVFCKKMLNLPVQIFLMEDFYKHLVDEHIKINHPNKNGSNLSIILQNGDEKTSIDHTINFDKRYYY
jgi:hypothetical protein